MSPGVKYTGNSFSFFKINLFKYCLKDLVKVVEKRVKERNDLILKIADLNSILKASQNKTSSVSYARFVAFVKENKLYKCIEEVNNQIFSSRVNHSQFTEEYLKEIEEIHKVSK